jgi:hypothetical protein
MAVYPRHRTEAAVKPGHCCRRALRRSLAAAALAALAGACSHTAPADWQLIARQSMERASEAYLSGDNRLESFEFEAARAQIARTGRVDLMARLELMRCAARVASLVFETCEGFEAARESAADDERVYADYLAGRLDPRQIDHLPRAQQAAARAAIGDGRDANSSIKEQREAAPLSALVASAVLLRAGHTDPVTISNAIDIASDRGWRRPLLAWLGVALMRAQSAADTKEIDRLRRRIDLVQGTP